MKRTVYQVITPQRSKTSTIRETNEKLHLKTLLTAH